MKKVWILVLLFTASVFAVSENAGTSGMTFLKIDYSPYSASLGGATSGYAIGPDGFLSNPASMSFEKDLSFGSSFGLLYAGISDGDLFVQKGFSFGKLGLAGRFVTYGSMDKTDSLGNVIGDLSATDIAISAVYSKEVIERLSIGIAPFFASSSIDDFSGVAFGCDLGSLYKFDRGKGRVGLTAKNIGVLSWANSDSSDPLPTTVSLGASYRLQGLPLFAMAQGDWSNDAGFSGGFGIEVVQLKPLYLRVGYRIRPHISGELADNEDFNGIAAGFGLKLKGVYADYSFQHFGALGMTHKFAISYDGLSD
jgi:hypothetical protein